MNRQVGARTFDEIVDDLLELVFSAAHAGFNAGMQFDPDEVDEEELSGEEAPGIDHPEDSENRAHELAVELLEAYGVDASDVAVRGRASGRLPQTREVLRENRDLSKMIRDVGLVRVELVDVDPDRPCELCEYMRASTRLVHAIEANRDLYACAGCIPPIAVHVVDQL